MLAPWKESYDQPRQHTKKQRDYFADKGPSSQSYGFSSSQVWMWKLDYKESWAPKKWYFLTVVLEKTLESPLDCKEIQPVHSEGDQPWIFIGRTDAEVETPILWPPDVKSWLIGKTPWCWERLKAEGKGDDRGRDGCHAAVHGVAKSWTQLVDWTTTRRQLESWNNQSYLQRKWGRRMETGRRQKPVTRQHLKREEKGKSWRRQRKWLTEGEGGSQGTQVNKTSPRSHSLDFANRTLLVI